MNDLGCAEGNSEVESRPRLAGGSPWAGRWCSGADTQQVPTPIGLGPPCLFEHSTASYQGTNRWSPPASLPNFPKDALRMLRITLPAPFSQRIQFARCSPGLRPIKPRASPALLQPHPLFLRTSHSTASSSSSTTTTTSPAAMSFNIPKVQKAAIVEKTSEPLKIIDNHPVKQPSELAPGECLVELDCSGVCHTDLHARNGDWPIQAKLPLIGGHEVTRIYFLFFPRTRALTRLWLLSRALAASSPSASTPRTPPSRSATASASSGSPTRARIASPAARALSRVRLVLAVPAQSRLVLTSFLTFL